MAARRVADENRQLRELLHKQGVSEEYISHFLQTSMVAPDLNTTFSAGNPGPSVQSLTQLMAPRRPNSLDPNVPFPLPSQASRENSIASASTSTSSIWEGPPHGISSSYGHHQTMNVPNVMAGPSGTQGYSTPVYSGDSTPRVDTYSGQPQGNIQLETQRHQNYNPQQQMQPPEIQGPGPMNYSNPNAPPYHHADPRDYGPPGGYC